MLPPPATTADVQDLIAWALGHSKALEVVGGGSKRGYGRPVEAAATLNLAGLKGIVTYEPRELICVVRPGTPLVELEATLAGEGQHLAFEPPHWGAEATIGGAIACNLAGPRRFRAGAARDHLLGFQAVSGRAEVFHGGGRVVKNVTGYDLSKLMCGSFGTLAALTELCLKVLPAPETEATLVAPGLERRAALALLGEAARTPHEPSGLAWLPGSLPLPAPVAGLAPAGSGLALIRIEGPAPSVAYRAGELGRLIAATPLALGHLPLEAEASRDLWRAVRELEPLTVKAGERLWRLSLPATAAERALGALERAGAEGLGPARGLVDWGGALVWTILPTGVAGGRVHAIAAEAGGHARLLRAAEPPEPRLDVFGPLSPGQRLLHQNLKRAFDPQRLLNPGRMYPEI
jgi:glycolate oxidase FAD binding subunit